MDYQETQFLISRFGPTVEKMPYDSIYIVSTELEINGKPTDIPVIVMRGDVGSRLSTNEISIRLAGFHTSFCPVVTIDLIFPFQEGSFDSSYWIFLPMNSANQRSLLRIIMKSRFWFLVAFCGNVPMKRMFIPIGIKSSQSYSEAWHLVSQYPVDPNANTDSAVKAVMRLIDKVVPGFKPLDVRDGREG
jgi:hypothetical protein